MNKNKRIFSRTAICAMAFSLVFASGCGSKTEEADNGKKLQLLKISKSPDFRYENGYITANGFRESEDEGLYFEYRESEVTPVRLRFIPYYRWGNRGENEMNVYIRI